MISSNYKVKKKRKIQQKNALVSSRFRPFLRFFGIQIDQRGQAGDSSVIG